MKAIKQRLKSKTYIINLLAAVGVFAAENAGILGISGQGVVILAAVNLVLRELTNKPLSAK